ncbi:MAG: hypothetical protein AAF393_05635 [Pseudomonadota bacterium]
MATQYKKVLLGGSKGIDVKRADVAKIAMELASFLKAQGVQAQGIKLPGLAKAQKLIASAQRDLAKGMKSKHAQEMGMSPELKVIGGIDTKGHISVTVKGLLPPKKTGKPPENYDKTQVIRKDFNKLLAELQNDKNVVTNLTRDLPTALKLLDPIAKKHKGDEAKMMRDKAYLAVLKAFDGDPVVQTAANRAAAKYSPGDGAKRKDEADYGSITTGNIVLVAHGDRVKVSGRTLGTKLGKMSPKQIVAYLTENKDSDKNLSKKFKGTLFLCGCFTAAGGIAPSPDYNYDTYAGAVWKLLKAKGINCKVTGNLGQGRVLEDGKSASVTPTGQDEYDELKTEVRQLVAAINGQQKKLKSGDPRAVASANRAIKVLTARAKKQNARKELNVIKELVGNYGLDPVR